MIFQESNFYTAMAIFYFDLVVFGTAVMLIYEDFDNVIRCVNPCFGEYYIDIDGNYRPTIFYREYTLTIQQVVDKFGIENCSQMVAEQYNLLSGAGRTREIIVAHAIEPNDNPEKYGIPRAFAFRETYWEWGGTTNPQSGTTSLGFLRKRGYYEQCAIVGRWDLVSNDAYGRSVGMDGLPDIKQLQQETRRKAQGIDKVVNPPLMADVQMKNQPASMLPGGVTYIHGMLATGNDGMKPVYGNWRPDIKTIAEDIGLIQARIKQTFYNDLFQVASQFETRSNITAVEWDMRKSESLVMLGPVLERIQNEVLAPTIARVWAIAWRSKVLPPPPASAQAALGFNVNVEYVSMLATSQEAAQAGSIERVLQMAGQLAGIDPRIVDKVDFDASLDIYSKLLNNDPRMMRSDAAVMQMRQEAAAQQAAAAASGPCGEIRWRSRIRWLHRCRRWTERGAENARGAAVVTDASNRKTIRRLEKAAAISDSNRIAFTKTIMSTPFGREWMCNLLTRCNVFHTPFAAGRADVTSFQCGAQNVGLAIFADVVTHTPDQYVIMMQEQAIKEQVNGRRDNDDASADAPADATGTGEDSGRDDNRRIEDDADPSRYVDENGFVLGRPN